MNMLFKLGENRYFWLTGIIYLALMEAIALYYQYGPGMWYPCALCVQVRAWVMGSLIFYYAFGVEQGTVISSCTMGAGFPEFMPLDQWVPVLFEAQGMCGQSPPMPLGVSMVEALLITLFIPLLVLVAVWVSHVQKIIANETD